MIGIWTRMLLLTLFVTLFLADSEAWFFRRRRSNPPPPPTTTPAPRCGGCTGSPSVERACRQTRTVARPTPVQTCSGWWIWRSCRTVYRSRNYVGERYTCCSGYALANGMCHRGGTISQYCGKSKYTDSASRGTSAMIVGGTSARPNEFPWMISFRGSGGHFCGGSILNENWILTAAHCVSGKSTSSFSVYAGEHQLYTSNEPTQSIHSANQVRIYPGYVSSTSLHDIALVRVSPPIALNADRFPICLPTDSDAYASNPWYVMGWGRTSTSNTGPASNILLYARVYRSDRSRCHYNRLDQNDVCVTDNSGDDDRGVCSGDSGGPLAQKTGYYTAVGVASFGHPDGCAVRRPAGFTKVGPYLQWIYAYILY